MKTRTAHHVTPSPQPSAKHSSAVDFTDHEVSDCEISDHEFQSDNSLDAEDRPQEECGVFGIYAPGIDVARRTFFGIFALQHRGQESAGIAVSDVPDRAIGQGLPESYFSN